jgi:hypothetical protein
MHESIHQPTSSYQQHYPSPYIARGNNLFFQQNSSFVYLLLI